jgi:LPS-assembly lipoprotein
MWWPKARKGGGSLGETPSRRDALRVLLVAAVSAPALAACSSGFKPMYGSAEFGGAESKLAKLDVAPIPGRVGQRIRNELIFQSTGGAGQTAQPEYRLEVALRESVSSTLVKVNAEAQGAVYTLDAAFKLVRLADKKVVLEGNSHGRAPFERFDSIFANVRAREDAENRAASTVGTELKTRLAAYLSGAA